MSTFQMLWLKAQKAQNPMAAIGDSFIFLR